MSSVPSGPTGFPRVPLPVQILAWLIGLLACIAGMVNLIAEWDPAVATVQFLWMIIAPVVWMLERRRSLPATSNSNAPSRHVVPWFLAIAVGLTSWCTCAWVGHDMVELPPAYHDEYSYLFETRLVLSGAFSLPGHPSHPELFDQMHVLNEGRMASRYYPGTALWFAPSVAIRHPYWAQWFASALSSIFVFWTGYELGRLRVALVSGLTFALSPGVALFGNLMLAHQPTLVSLTLFMWAFVKWQRSRSVWHALISGLGLSFAMLCRPATAAGFGLPFGIAFLCWMLMARDEGQSVRWSRRFAVFLAMGLPIMAGWSVMLAYNRDVTGSWTTSPYQLYTETYTPRHVYGFNNGNRGDLKKGPKVIDAYDRWAVNLTPELAATNVRDRLISSWLWTFDVLPLLMSLIVILGVFHRIDLRGIGVVLAIVSLHAIHVPYWYTGIMGWHYVFETAPLWCLVLGLATDQLCRDWRTAGRWLMSSWWTLLLLISMAADYLPHAALSSITTKAGRVYTGVGSIRHPRRQYAEFDRWLDSSVTKRPALVLIEFDPNDQHVDYVVNAPGWNAPILRGRFRPGINDLDAIVRNFPDRQVYLCQPSRQKIEPVYPGVR